MDIEQQLHTRGINRSDSFQWGRLLAVYINIQVWELNLDGFNMHGNQVD